ncbi:MAG TPA: carboxypeptidase-like regulatory domain-containing protein [Candidatus Kapabacteria bacterium]|nr:carboxypeptidase-like regulatory domain-containing protein [Candidatus Kapabacteria bacterium]
MAAEAVQQRALAIGQILHQGTGLPVNGAITITSPEGIVVANVRSDGFFAVSGRPELLFPNLATMPATFDLEVHAESAQFRNGFFDTSVSIPLGAGEDFDPPVSAGTILLTADPVYIRGRAVSAVDPHPAIAGATIDLLEGGFVTHTTATAADGTYSFDNVTVLAPVELRCTAGGFTTETRAVTVDYGIPVNEISFRMTPP